MQISPSLAASDIAGANLMLTPANWPTIQRQARKNHRDCMYLLGVAYLLGGYVDQDKTRAYFWFKKAAEKGHADAAFRCGVLSQELEQSDHPPTYWYQKASELGSGAGSCALANQWTYPKIQRLSASRAKVSFIQHLPWLRWGWWLAPENSEEARAAYQMYEKAYTEQKYLRALYYIGLHQLHGWGTPRDVIKAQGHLKQSVDEESDRHSAYLLATTYPRSSSEYWEYMEKSADWGLPTAQYILARSQLFKTQNEQMQDKAISWLKRAAIQRYVPAMQLLAYALSRRGNPRFDYEAYQWAYRAHAEGGFSATILNSLYAKLSDEDKYRADQIQNEDLQEFQKTSERLFQQPGTSW